MTQVQRHNGANRTQRERRAKNPRVDYYPSQEALAIMAAKRDDRYPLNTNSGIIDAILAEWAELTGIKYRSEIAPPSPGESPELTDASARANDFGGTPAWLLTENKSKPSVKRVTCGARRRSDGQPCQAKSVLGKRRCKWHGGCSTGPRTSEGRANALKNLRQYRAKSSSKVEANRSGAEGPAQDRRRAAG